MKKHTKKSWTYSDDMELVKLYNEGKSSKFLAENFNRSVSAISARVSRFREYGYIDSSHNPRSDFSRETMAEMKDAVSRFEKISSIPLEWKVDWAERNKKNLLQVGDKLSKLYEKERE